MCADQLLGIGIAIRPHAGGHVGGIDARRGQTALDLVGQLYPLQRQIGGIGARMAKAEQRPDGIGGDALGAADIGTGFAHRQFLIIQGA